MGRISEAIEQLKAALRINPNHTDARNNLTKLEAAAENHTGKEMKIAMVGERSLKRPACGFIGCLIHAQRIDAALATRLKRDRHLRSILNEIATHAEANPNWLEPFGSVMTAEPKRNDLELLSVVIPARDEEGCIASTVEHLHRELRAQDVPHEIVVVDDGSSDRTRDILEQLKLRLPNLVPIRNTGLHGFGRAVTCGLNQAQGDAVVIMMADESDDNRDVGPLLGGELKGSLLRVWQPVHEGRRRDELSAVETGFKPARLQFFGPEIFFFRIRNFNDTTNAFKAYRRTVIDGCVAR